ncbi:MAG: ABC transporter substrate-binding protein [Alphaproteobacteria bacterium]|nr:ABC transporter substrate-binding protein [Alphaproteobacteria bacterium]MBQ8630365.1 ABC transporter substrate-binding protein [Alphaproteobacteria bacterium]
MKKNIFAAVFAAILLMTGNVRANVDAAGAEAFVKNVTNDGIENIINANISQKEKDTRFEKLFNNALDLDFIGKFVLGRAWRTATPQQRKDFIATYRELNIKTWSKRFDEFKGKNFIFKGTTPSNSPNQIFVNTTVPMDQGEPAKVVWRVKQNGSQFKVVDIIIENVSLAITARNEYAGFIKNNAGGVDALIKDLQAKVKAM